MRAIFLAMSGRTQEAVSLLGGLPQLTSEVTDVVMNSLRAAQYADRAAVGPLVQSMRARGELAGRQQNRH